MSNHHFRPTLASCLALALLCGPAAAQTAPTIVGWGNNNSGQLNLPALPTSVVSVAMGGGDLIALHFNDGTVTVQGSNLPSIPALPLGMTYLEVDLGGNHALLRRSDNTIFVVGGASYHANVPALPFNTIYTQLDAGSTHNAAVRSDGSVVCWGSNLVGECNVPSLPVSTVYVEVAAGDKFTVARRKVQQAGRATEHGAPDLAAFVFQRKIAMPAGCTRKTRNLAAYGHGVEPCVQCISNGAA